MPQNPPDGVQRVSVRLAYQRIPEALAFLQAAFGFPERVDRRLEGPNGSIIVTEIAVGDAYIVLGGAGSHGVLSPRNAGGATEGLMVYVDDVDAHFQRAKAGGAEIVSEPSDQYWGDRRYEARDIEGHVWFFHQRTRDVSKEEIARIEEGFRKPPT